MTCQRCRRCHLIFFECNAKYVEGVEDGKRTYIHIFAHNFLNIQLIFNPEKVLES